MTLARSVVVPGTIKEYGDFADLLRTLSSDQWETPSRCAGWRVADVAAHVVGQLNDVTAFRFDGLGTPEVTERQVDERRGSTPDALAVELQTCVKARPISSEGSTTRPSSPRASGQRPDPRLRPGVAVVRHLPSRRRHPRRPWAVDHLPGRRRTLGVAHLAGAVAAAVVSGDPPVPPDSTSSASRAATIRGSSVGTRGDSSWSQPAGPTPSRWDSIRRSTSIAETRRSDGKSARTSNDPPERWPEALLLRRPRRTQVAAVDEAGTRVWVLAS